MDQLIEAIRAATAEGATAENKAKAAQACRTVAAALEAESGKPVVLPGAPSAGPLSGISAEQALDLLITRLRGVVADRDKARAEVSTPVVRRATSVTPRARLQFPLVQPPSATVNASRPARSKTRRGPAPR